MGLLLSARPTMDNALGSAMAPIPPAKKAAARAALVDLKEPAKTVLTDCFRQFGIEPVALNGDAAARLAKEKFEACVIPLDGGAASVMDAARTSASNSRIVLYGLGGSAQDSMRFSKYGINAMFHEPLERGAALKLVRATRMLVSHEFRRYVRIPVITEVAITCADGARLTATSVEVSSGGMSLKAGANLEPGSPVEVSFALLTLPRIWIRGNVTWKKSKNVVGIKFDSTDNRRTKLKEWIVASVEN
jgi:hypothetical protein